MNKELGEEKMSRYETFLVHAISNVEKKYYKIKTTYNNGVVRERVFCYELYHQMRLLQIQYGLENLELSGEIDKRGHLDIKSNDYRNPDFIFHKYGEFESNKIIVEIKGTTNFNGIKKDFQTLMIYLERYQYKYGFFLLYNSNLEEFKEKFISILNKEDFLSFKKLVNICVICKKDYDSKCEVIRLHKLLIDKND